jgi:aspartyl-tRNA(Asn)/glutamyl-tRNA(Gln) amidotransferase subunit A
MELYRLTAYEAAEKLRNKEISATELLEIIFKRIEEVEDKVGSFVSLRKEEALEEAKIVDEKIARGEGLKPFEGIPVALKDNMVSMGDPATASSKILYNYEGIYDATVVKKLKDQGAIIIGKTNMDEFAMGSTTKTSFVKETKKPLGFRQGTWRKFRRGSCFCSGW